MEFSNDITNIYIDAANVIVVNQGGLPSITSTSLELEQYVHTNKEGTSLYITIDSTYNNNKPTTYHMKINVSGLNTCSVELQNGTLDAAAICPNATSYILHKGILTADIPTTYYNKLNVSVDSGVIDVNEYNRASNGALLKKYPELLAYGKHISVINGQQKEGGNIWAVHVDQGKIVVRGDK